MKNKGFIVTITIVITLLCLYYLQFTFVSLRIANEAREYAKDKTGNVDFAKRQSYLDSIWNLPVYLHSQNFMKASWNKR